MSSILHSSKTRFTQGRSFCALVRDEPIFAVCKRCANEGFACMCKENVTLSWRLDVRVGARVYACVRLSNFQTIIIHKRLEISS